MRVAVIGTGYLGTTHAACVSQIGHDVVGVDIDAEKVVKLQSGEVPFFEPDLESLVRENLASGRLRFTTSYEEAAEFADVHFASGIARTIEWHASHFHANLASCDPSSAPRIG